MQLFAETCEKLSNESSTLNKIEIISSVIKEIQNDNELYLFCLYLTGVVYPSNIQKTINVGKAWIRDAAIKLFGIEKEEWDKAFNQFGETGETIEYLMANLPKQSGVTNDIFNNTTTNEEEDSITLEDFRSYINELNITSGSLKKVEIIKDLLRKLTPIEGKYVTKILLGRLRIGVQEATVEDSISKAYEIDKKEVKKINFHIGDIGEVAVRCKNKDFNNIEFVLGHPIRAMLASAEVDTQEIFKRMGENVWLEYKYDGIRAHIHKTDSRVEIFTRDLKNISQQFPEVCEEMKKFNGNFLLDGEIVPFRDDKIQAFADLQKRLGKKDKIEEAVLENPTRFIAYDFLYLNGETLFTKSLAERRLLLEETFGKELMYSSKKIVNTPEEFHSFFRQSKSEGREGLMIKNPSSVYESGKRGINWLKYKETLDPLDVVVLKVEYGEGKNSKYLSNYTFGVWDENKEVLVPVGRVYSGIKEEDMKYFTDYMPTIATEPIARGFKLEPKVIFEVGFENIQKSERYSSGYAVRFPRILRIRTNDKPLEEINTINDIKMAWEKLNVIEMKR